MTNENSILFPCIDNQNDGCLNMVSTLGAHCPDCAEFHASMAEAKALLADESWKNYKSLDAAYGNAITAIDEALSVLPGFEPVNIVEEEAKPDLDTICYTMNAAEVDCQNALREIAQVLQKFSDNLKQVDIVLASYEVH